MEIDYKYWFSFDYWSLEQAAYLFSNIDPRDEDHIFLINNDSYKRSHANHWNILETFNNHLQLLKGTDLSKYENIEVPEGTISLNAIFKLAKEKKLGRFPSRLCLKWENYSINQKELAEITRVVAVKNKTSVANGNHFAQDMVGAFDPMPISGIAQLFSSVTSYNPDKWKTYASKAKSNGLIIARTGVKGGRAESTFNPVLVANWLITKNGISAEKLNRKLKNNLPNRSNNLLEDLFPDE